MSTTRRRRNPALAVAGLALLAPGIAAASGPTASIRAATPTVNVTVAPASLTATGDARTGPLRLTFAAARGSDPTGVALVELRPGHTPAELRALDLAGLENAGPLERIGRLVAGAAVRPGHTYRTTISARARTYAAVDVTHERGPQTTFTVSGPPSAPGVPPSDARVIIRDTAFELPSRLPADGVVEIVNRGTRPHHALAVRVPARVRTSRALRLVRDGRIGRLGAAVDLVGLVSPRTRNRVELHLEPGRYVVVSLYGALLPDAKPDALAGLIAPVRVH